MTILRDGPVVVGVDGSASARAAVALGVSEARRHQRPIRLVHAFVWPIFGVPLGPAPSGPADAGLRADAERVLADAIAHASALDPQVPVSGEVVEGTAAPVLLAEAGRAAMTVVGNRGLGGFAGLLLGSVASQVAAHAPGTVLVARGQPTSEGPVVVGVDGSDSAAAALDFAFVEADTRGADLLAITTWYGRLSAQTVDRLPLIYDASDVTAEFDRLLESALADARQRVPAAAQVPVRHEVHHGRAARTLVEASTTAQLVVVGARGGGGLAGLRLGSVSQAMLHHAECPVAIVRAGAA